MTISPTLFPAVTVTVVRDRKIRTALRTNQIAEFVTVPSWKKNKYMLLAGWEVRIGKNCDRGLENAARGHSFSLYGPTLRRPITFLSFSSCRSLAYKFFTSGFVYAILPSNRLTRRLQYKPFAKNLTSKRSNKSNTIRRKMY